MFKVFDTEQAANVIQLTSAHARLCFLKHPVKQQYVMSEASVQHTEVFLSDLVVRGGLSLGYSTLKSFVMSYSPQNYCRRGNVSKLLCYRLAV